MSNYSEESILNYLGPYQGDTSAVLRSLQLIQELLGYVPDSALDLVAKNCGVSRAEVYGVFTFYSDFRSTPPAKVVVKVCVAEACQDGRDDRLVEGGAAQVCRGAVGEEWRGCDPSRSLRSLE